MKQISFKKHRFTPENKRGPKPQHRAHRAVPDRLKRIAGRGFRLGMKCHDMIKLARRLDCVNSIRLCRRTKHLVLLWITAHLIGRTPRLARPAGPWVVRAPRWRFQSGEPPMPRKMARGCCQSNRNQSLLGVALACRCIFRHDVLPSVRAELK